MTITISKTLGIEFAHYFPGHPVKANQRVHGHSVWITVTSTRDDELLGGMVMDFGVFESQVKTIAMSLDHQLLNDIPDLGEPTLENIAAYIGKRMGIIAGPLRVVSVKVERPSQGQTVEWTP